jgi:hypothetical protein
MIVLCWRCPTALLLAWCAVVYEFEHGLEGWANSTSEVRGLWCLAA